MRRLQLGRFVAQQSSLLLLLALIAVLAGLSGGSTVSGYNIENVARQIALSAPVAMGQAVVLIAGGVDLSVGSVLAMSGALAVGLQPHGVWVAVLAALAFGVGVGLVNGLLVARAGIAPFIVTLGTMSLFTGVLLTYTHEQPIPGREHSFTVWGGGSVGFVPVPAIIAVVVGLVLHGVLRYTRSGRNVYAVGGNPEAAHVAGISIARHQVLAFAMSGFCAALSGVLLASSLDSASVQVGVDTPLLSLAAAIIGGASLLGGRGGIGGALIGVAVLGVLANGMDSLGVPTYYQIGTRALILIAVVAFDAVHSNLLGRRAGPGAGPRVEAPQPGLAPGGGGG
jgi:ribose/xylose/arabinose/galactoside ABC-type transport system permease subunit